MGADLEFDAIFYRSLPLALQLGEHFMSTSVVTLTKGLSITRPKTLLIFDLAQNPASVLGDDLGFSPREKKS